MSKLYCYVTFLALMAYLAVVKLVLVVVDFPPEMFPHPSQRETFEWQFIAVLTVAGLIGVWLSQRTGFPEMWHATISQKQRFLVPALLGLAFGLVEVSVDAGTGMAKLVAEKLSLPFFHMRFPASALIYPGGAIIVDTLYRLVPIPLVMGLILVIGWLIAPTKDPGKPVFGLQTRERIFWAVAILLSWFEPITQSGVLAPILGRKMTFKGHEGLVVYWLIDGYTFNLTQAYLFRKFGFLASLTMRVSMYLIWHVLWGYASQA